MTADHGYVPYTKGCWCEVCRQAKADYMRARRNRARGRARLVDDPNSYHYVPDIAHGRTGYEEHGCRCPECLAARAEQSRDLTRKRRAKAVAS